MADPRSPDKAWGIAIVVLSTLGICLHLALASMGAFLGPILETMADETARMAGEGGVTTAPASSGGDGTFTGILIGIGGVLALSSAFQLVGGIGIFKGRRWGFLLTGGFATLSILLSLPSMNPLMIAISGVFVFYCATRLRGKKGSVPL